MRTLVAFSAGIDSTAMAYLLLQRTAHDVVLVHYDETWVGMNGYDVDRERACVSACADWLSEHVRPLAAVRFVDSMVVEDRNTPRRYQIRPAFAEIIEGNYIGWGYSRLATMAREAKGVEADEVVYGRTTWDMDSDWLDRWAIPYWYSLTAIPLRFPFLTKRRKDGLWDGPGRFEIQSHLPGDLWQRTVPCGFGPPSCGICARCRLSWYYAEHCAGKAVEEIAAIDDEIERRYSLGRYYNQANPETYRVSDKYRL